MVNQAKARVHHDQFMLSVLLCQYVATMAVAFTGWGIVWSMHIKLVVSLMLLHHLVLKSSEKSF